jgi:AMP nucleosidase
MEAHSESKGTHVFDSTVTKEDIVQNWLPRYTGVPVEELGRYILLTNFSQYVRLFSNWHRVPIRGTDCEMPNATSNGITIINLGMGSANAATIMDLLTALRPEACLFLGKCGSIKEEIGLGELILPIAAIRGDGTSNDYFPPEVPALPAFALQKAISTTIREHQKDYWTGTVYSTNRRIWEHDESFKGYLKLTRSMAIDMESATIFTVGFHNHIPTGALLLVSDQPMFPEGIKTQESDRKVSENFVSEHLKIGLEALRQLIENRLTVRHLKF